MDSGPGRNKQGNSMTGTTAGPRHCSWSTWRPGANKSEFFGYTWFTFIFIVACRVNICPPGYSNLHFRMDIDSVPRWSSCEAVLLFKQNLYISLFSWGLGWPMCRWFYLVFFFFTKSGIQQEKTTSSFHFYFEVVACQNRVLYVWMFTFVRNNGPELHTANHRDPSGAGSACWK